MSILFLTIYIGLSPIIGSVLMVGSMIVSLKYFSSDALFFLSETTLSRTLQNNSSVLQKQKDKAYSWSDVKGYKRGTDRGKYRGEYQYLDIKFKNGDEWKLTDTYGEQKEDYNLFLNFFLSKVDSINNFSRINLPPISPTETTLTNEVKIEPLIIREKTFYETIFSKIFTVLLGVFVVIVLAFGWKYLSAASIFKLIFVLIPGFLYMYYRTFIKKYQ